LFVTLLEEICENYNVDASPIRGLLLAVRPVAERVCFSQVLNPDQMYGVMK